MSTKIKDLEAHLGRVQAKAISLKWEEKVLSVAIPEPSLYTELGPLTGKIEKENTLQCAAVLWMEFSGNSKFTAQVYSLRNKYNLSTSQSGNSGLTLFSSFNTAVSLLSISIAGVGAKEFDKKQPPSPLVKFLDAMFVKTLTSIPIAGPILAACATHLGAVLGEIGKLGFNAIAYYGVGAPPEDKSTLASVVGGQTRTNGIAFNTVVGAGSTTSAAVSNAMAPVPGGGVASFFYNLYKSHQEKKLYEGVAKFHQAGRPSISLDGVRIMNPQTQNQVASNRIVDRLYSTIPAMPGNTDIDSLVQEKCETINDFYNKVPKVLNAYTSYLSRIVNISIVDSLTSETDELANKIRALALMHNARIVAPAERMDLASLLVMGYYFNRFMKNNPDHAPYFVGRMKAYYPRWEVRGAPRAFVKLSTLSGVLPPSSKTIIDAFKKEQKFKSLLTDPVTEAGKFSRFKHLVGGSHPHQREIDDAISLIGSNSANYFHHLKSSLSNTVAQNLSRGERSGPQIDKIVRLVASCTLIVNAVLVAAVAKKSFTYQDSWIDTLAELGFVRKYSKWFGQIGEDKKKEITGQVVAGRVSAESSNFRLRYPNNLPSDSERTMVYMFASIVVLNVDLGKIVMGDQKWANVKDNLYKLIGVINEAEM